MATAPRPPLPPAPPRSGSNVLAIVLLILALIIVASGLAVWTGLRFLSRGVQVHVNRQDGEKQVSIKTPFGGIEVNKSYAVTEASLGLPLYPGAKQIKNEDSASVSLGLPGQNNLRIVAGKFETPDPLDKVRNFYETSLSVEEGTFTHTSNPSDFDTDRWESGEANYEGKDREGKTVFKIKRKDDERVVALKSEWNGTRIELVRLRHNSGEAN